jgi:hypothetical protein
MNNFGKLADLPRKVQDQVTGCDLEFRRVVAAITAFVASKTAVRNPITKTFLIARPDEEDGYGGRDGNAPEKHESWNIYWVALINDFRETDVDEWMWVTSSFYRGEATNGIVFSCEINFDGNKLIQGRASSDWSVCGPVPNKNHNRIEYSTCNHQFEAAENVFEEMTLRVLRAVQENQIRRDARDLFAKL